MKRNLDLVRDILLFVGEKSETVDFFSVQIHGYSERELNYHVYLLMEEKFITGAGPTVRHATVAISGLTWKGHEYLDTVRSDNVWNKTKELVKPLGSASVDVVAQIAKDVFLKSVAGA